MDCNNSISGWVEKEFGNIIFRDLRLSKRFKDVMVEFTKKAQLNISSVFSSWSSIKGCYRFLDNSKTKSDIILDKHVNATISRINENKTIVCIIHDTSIIDYKTRKKAVDLDYFASGSKLSAGSKGLILHNSFAVTESAIPLGLVSQKFIERKLLRTGSRAEKKHIIHKMPVESKESYRWVESIHKFKQLSCKNNHIIHIADREGDFYELYRECIDLGEKFVIRSSHNRSINKQKRREKPKIMLHDYFASLTPSNKEIIDIQCNGDSKYRKVELSIAYDNFTLSPPPNRTVNKDGDKLYNLDLYGVIAKEENPPNGEEGLKWLLITNIPILSAEDALEKVKLYSLRWNIETFHKILKSGCSIEAAQLRSREKLIKYITIKSIIAWRIFWLSRNFRINKEVNSSVVLTKIEQQILLKRFSTKDIEYHNISAEQACIWIAKLGGYIGRKSDPPPGIISIWRGWSRFMEMIEDYELFCG